MLDALLNGKPYSLHLFILVIIKLSRREKNAFTQTLSGGSFDYDCGGGCAATAFVSSKLFSMLCVVRKIFLIKTK